MAERPKRNSLTVDSASSVDTELHLGSRQQTRSIVPHEPSAPQCLTDYAEEGRFPPGKMLAGRYRIIGLIGRGGMGEVYRATDLLVGQAVALKFLPSCSAPDEAAHRRLYQEVRLARRISHSNVCRVYDTGAVDGHPYISMEYVDGEDLGSLLRRIGRVPRDKAVEIARQLCAGLAAAHGQGILHRDLKPSNVMINGRGEVVITDFGLAGVAGQIQTGEVGEGTPGYMAPEQIAGKEVSAKSDIYALGLVLYEVFTGKRAFEAHSRVEMARLQAGMPASPSSIVRDLDLATERTILCCLSVDPRNRPPSAMAVAASLPGGDPLTAALAWGHTPSPETVAAAGQIGDTGSPAAPLCMAGVVIGLLLWAWLAPNANVLSRIALDNAPAVLRLKALGFSEKFGYPGPYLDSAEGLTYSRDHFRYFAEQGAHSTAAAHLMLNRQAAQVRFWFRRSPQYLIATDYLNSVAPGIVTASDPPGTQPGMINIELDAVGRLVAFAAVPDGQVGTAEARIEDWDSVFSAAGLDRGRFRPVEPEWTPSVVSDQRAAWAGYSADTPELPLRIEAGVWKGKLTYFQMIWPWTQASGRPGFVNTAGEAAASAVYGSIVLFIIASAALLARRNVRVGRGDQRGAFRVSAFLFALTLLLWLLAANHAPTVQEFSSAWAGFSAAISIAAVLWVFYVAFEPYVRRRWPHILIGWSRLLAGCVYDPIVGRDLLIGTVFGIAGSGAFLLVDWAKQRAGAPPPMYPQPYTLMGGYFRIAELLGDIRGGLLIGFAVVLLIFLLRLLLRNKWAAAAACILIFTTIDVLRSSHPRIEGPLVPLCYVLSLFLLLRFGLLAFITGITVNGILFDFPITLQFSTWYAREGLFGMLVILAIAAYGYYACLGGRPMFRDDSLQ